MRNTGRDGTGARLVVVEQGSHWPRAGTFPGDSTDETLVVGQKDTESPIDLARRVLRTLAGLATNGQAPEHAVLVISPRLDDAAATSRHVMARAFLHWMGLENGSGELVLVVEGGGPPGLRQAVMSLLDVLVLSQRVSSVAVRVRFDECDAFEAPVRESGLRIRGVGPIEGAVSTDRAAAGQRSS